MISAVKSTKNLGGRTKSYRHNALHSKSRQGDKYGRPDEGSDPTFGVGSIAYPSDRGLLTKPSTQLPCLRCVEVFYTAHRTHDERRKIV